MQFKHKQQTDCRSRLHEVIERLPDSARQSLLDFAEFLAQQVGTPTASLQLPLDVPRPDKESVVAAMKRLRETYPMIDHSKMLHEASGLMAQHLMQGRPAPEVIDDLTQIFKRHYDKYAESFTGQA